MILTRNMALPLFILSLASVTSAQAAAQSVQSPAPQPATAPTQAPSNSPARPQNQTPVEMVVVTARPNGQDTKIDRTTYDVRTLPDAPLSPAIDVIARLPGVFVGPNNRISIAGGAFVTILVDGRPMLRDAALQIPAERIASIEVVSNPPAEFASSSEAVINIVLKKTQATARASGSIGASIDTLDNSSVNLSLDRSKGDWGLSLSMRFADRGSEYTSGSETLFLTARPGEVSQRAASGVSRTESKQGSGFVRLTYDLTEFENFEFTTSLFQLEGGATGNSLENASIGNSVRLASEDYNVDFSVEGGYVGLTFKSDHEKDYKFESNVNFGRNNYDQFNSVQRTNLFQQQDQSNEDVNGSLDAKFEKHLPKDRLLTTGIVISSMDYRRAYNDLGFLGPIVRQNDLFDLAQQEFAAYATYQFKLGNLGILPGIRFERSANDWSSRLAASGGDYSYERVFPSLFLTHKLGENGKLRASYSEGTTSLSADQLNPSLRYFSRTSATQGNPFLEPADRRTIELGYDYDKDSVSLVSTLFYRDTRNQVVNVSRRIGGELIVSSPINLGETIAYGLGSTLKGKFNPKLNYTLNFEVSSNSFSNPLLGVGQTVDDQIAYNGKFILDYKPNSVDQFSATATFQSDVIGVGSFRSGFWTTNFQFTHKFPNKVSLVVNAIDIGVSPGRISRQNGPGFSSASRNEEATRALRVGLTKRY